MPVITIKWIIIYQHQVTVLACTSSMVTVIACTIGIVTVSTCTIRMVTVLTCTSSMVTALACTSVIVTVWHVLVAWLQYWQLQYTKRAPLVNSSDVGPMTRLSVDTSDHRDVRTVTWNHGYDGLWSESHVPFVAVAVRCLPIHLSHRCFPIHLSHRCLLIHFCHTCFSIHLSHSCFPIHLSHRKRPHLLNTHRLPSV